MSDPYTREFVGEDQDFSPEVYENIRAKETELDAEINDGIKTAETIESEERQVDLSPDTPKRTKPQQQQPEQTEEVEASEEKPSEDLGQRLQDNVGKLFGMAQDAGEKLKPLKELSDAPAVGSIDFVRDSLNLIPHVNIPKVRKFESEYAEASRELSSFLLPSLFLGAGGKALGVAAASKYPVATKLPKFLGGKEWVAGRDALVKLFGRTGVELGTGVFVDYANAYSAEGNNFSGTVREMFPSTQRWISTDIATLSSDSPDVKRDKSVREGVGLGLASAFLEAAGSVARGIIGTVQQTRFIAGPDSAQSLIDELNEAVKKSNVPETEFSKAAESYKEAQDEIAAFMMSQKLNKGLDEPLFKPSEPPPIKDTRGQGKFYHGASAEFDLVPGGQYGGEKNIYGSGLYVTDDFQTAASYKPKNRAKGVKKAEAAEQGVVYDVDMSKQNLFDLDGPAQQDFIDFLKEEKYEAMDELIERAIEDTITDAAQRGVVPTTAQFMDNMRGYSRSLEVPSYEITEVFEQYQDVLKKKGFTGYKHKGGMKAGKGKREHQVAIIFDPDETSSINKVNQDDFRDTPPPVQGPVEPIQGVHEGALTPYESGVRTVDPGGILMAALDATKIFNNEGTVWGRLSNPVSEAARKYGLDAESLTKRTLVKLLSKQVADGGRWSGKLDGTGRFVDYEEHNAVGERLYELLADPRMEPGMMKELLDNFKSSIDDFGRKKQVLGNVAYNGVMKAMKFNLEEFADMNVNKATAYFSTANAGQISDMAEGARLMDGTEAVSKAQEMILDRLEYLMVEKGLASYNAGKTLNLMNMWKRFTNDPEKQAAIGMNAMHDTEEAFRNIVARSKNSVASLRFMAKERPSYLKPLQMMWEMSDGNIDTLAKMHTFVNNSLPMLNKGFIDLQPEIPNVILTGMKSTLYNSVLSAFATPIKAGQANAVLTAIKPLSVFAGAITDVRTLKRAAYQYSNLGDHIFKGMRHMGFVFKKASLDPTSVNYMLREDMASKNEATMNALKAFAESAEKDGNVGPMVLYTLAEQINDIANHPVLRFGGNAMASLDGFVRAFMGNVEVKGNIYDRMVNVPGTVPPKDVLRKAEKEHYDALFDKHGMINDSAVDFASREIAFNLDTEGSKSLSSLVKAYPVLGNILLFPRTGDNAIGMAFKFAPITAFSKDIDKLAGLSKNFTRNQMAEALQSRGIKVDEYIDVKFRNLRAEIRGRKAIAVMAGLAGAVMFSQDRLRGDGHFDKERQRARVKGGWEGRTFMGSDGRWYSYEFLGPIADIIAFQANVLDNHDTLDPMDMATLYNKSTHVLGASLFNKAMFAPLEPMFDMLGGNFSAATRFAGTMTSAAFPMSGQRAELSRIIVGGMSELNDNLLDAIHNRNKVIDVVDPKVALPKSYDWVDQRRIGYTENFFTRLYNGLGLPFAAADGISPERQFLIDIEYDGQPTFSKSAKGVEYTPAERSELFEIMGRDGLFRKRLGSIMKDYDADKFRAEVKRQQSIDPNVSRELFAGLYDRIDDALEEAKKEAEAHPDFSSAAEISTLEYRQQVNKFDQQEGKTPTFPLRNR